MARALRAWERMRPRLQWALGALTMTKGMAHGLEVAATTVGALVVVTSLVPVVAVWLAVLGARRNPQPLSRPRPAR
jgi:hypothetical protein